MSGRKKNKRSKGIGKDKPENKSGKKKSNFLPSVSGAMDTPEKPQVEQAAKKNEEKLRPAKGLSPTPNNR